MLAHDEAMWEALRSTQSGKPFGVATYQGASVPVPLVSSGSILFRSEGEVQASGTVRAAGVTGSLVPKSMTDPLASIGQEISLWRTVIIGEKEWPVPLGVYRITRSGDFVEEFRENEVLGWSVSLSLSDRFKKIRDDDFLAPESPLPGNSVWDEVRRLSPIPVQEAMGDTSVPPGTVYTTRLGAITTLINLLGGRPHLTREGVLTARSRDAWLTETVPVFVIDGVIDFGSEMTDDFYNQVKVSNPNDASIVAYWRLDDDSDPRSVRRAGGRTYTPQSSTIYETIEAAQVAANTIGARVSTRRAQTVTVVCTPEALLLELGDFGLVRDPVKRRQVLGEVSGIRVSLDPTAPVDVDLIVAEDSEYREPVLAPVSVFFDVGGEYLEGMAQLVPGDDLADLGEEGVLTILPGGHLAGSDGDVVEVP